MSRARQTEVLYLRPETAEGQQQLSLQARAAREVAGVLEAVPGYTSLYIEYDPGVISLEVLQRWLAEYQPQQATTHSKLARPDVEIPVCYNGEDLEEVAARAGLSTQEVAALHAAERYQVRALGFVAGFPFMETTPPPLQFPRRATPRPRVPAHSLAVAGAQTGIYPVEAPGGWNLLGRTLKPVYDPQADPPFLLEPGDWVRFIPGEGEPPAPMQPHQLLPAEPRLPVLQVQKSGVQDLVMDTGRRGAAHFGLVQSGAADRQSARIAQQLLGNSEGAPLLEMHLMGPVLRVLSDATLSCTGGLQAVVSGAEVAPYSSFQVRTGDTLSFKPTGMGRVGYLGLVGGLETAPFMGSSSTDLKSGIGQPLAVGDVLGAYSVHKRMERQFVPYWMTQPREKLYLRLLPLSADAPLLPSDIQAMQAGSYTLKDIDRMAARLGGPPVQGGEIQSEASPVGTVQVPPSGEVIILLSDKGTMGGYRKPARIHPDDLDRLSQAMPGTVLHFVVE